MEPRWDASDEGEIIGRVCSRIRPTTPLPGCGCAYRCRVRLQ